LKEKKEERTDQLEKLHRDRWIRWVLVGVGTFFVGLGLLGIFLPVLPTTPFLLLAAACYARSSERFYNWLLNHRWFAEYIRNYREGRGIPPRVKALSISLLWLMILISALFIVRPCMVKVILIGIAIGVTLYLLSVPNFCEPSSVRFEKITNEREDGKEVVRNQ